MFAALCCLVAATTSQLFSSLYAIPDALVKFVPGNLMTPELRAGPGASGVVRLHTL
jgi:hypothetical protein